MHNTREKLIELFREIYAKIMVVSFDELADHLIANGVTIPRDYHWATEQAHKNGYEDGKPKWIPVSERLPEEGTDVLAYQNRGEESRIVPANYGCAVWFDCFFDCEADNITHWMPLPQPPKGE